jgi:hypothetical protein
MALALRAKILFLYFDPTAGAVGYGDDRRLRRLVALSFLDDNSNSIANP